MEQINEVKSINDDIVNLSDLIADNILKDAPKQKRKISKVTGAFFVENEFTQRLYGEINGIDELKIHYILYDFESKGEYNQWLRTVCLNDEVKNYNSFSDYETKQIQIVSAYINDKILGDFIENVLHEITHLYQYGKGMEKRVNLYDKVIVMCSNDNIIASSVGRTVYYTFKHEQDAMTHQFYGYLLQNKPTEEFDNVCEKSEYGNALDYLYIVNKNKEEASKYIKELGFTFEQWNKRIYFGYKRFKQKLYNAYLLYIQQKNANFNITNESKTFEINLINQVYFDRMINEAKKKYGQLEFDIETIYQF